jgi:predicted GH43/DUF377 family glycosyl hydrolase
MSKDHFYQPTELFKRYEKNPILTPAMWPYKCNAVFNPAATVYQNKVLLMVRVEDMIGASHLCKAVSDDGLTDWQIDPKPTFTPKINDFPEEKYGVEDPRIVKLDMENTYAMVYTSYSVNGPLVSLATTEDFETFRRYGVVMPPDDKDASLFPRKFGGRWLLIHRPSPENPYLGSHIWISYSPDLKHWGDSTVLLPARRGSWWDAYKVGLGPQPIETHDGWLIIYHGVKTTASGSLYRIGLALLDIDDPSKVIKRCDEWIFGPHEKYERMGDVSYVTFPCGLITKGDELYMYYGAADTTVAVAVASIKEILEFIKNS